MTLPVVTPPVRLHFTEVMTGFVSFGETDYARGAREGEDSGTKLTLRLTVTFSDLDRLISGRDSQAQLEGLIKCDALGGTRPLEGGTFRLFVGDDPHRKTMRYRLRCRDSVGHPLTLIGVKTLQKRRGRGLYVWHDTTTLNLRVVQGWAAQDDRAGEVEVVASGRLRLGFLSFIRQLTTFRAAAPTLGARLAAVGRFDRFFLGQLWQLYGPIP